MPNGDENLTNFPDWMATFMQQGQGGGNRNAALRAIWDNRSDIRNAYAGNTMFPTPEQAVEDWLKNTTEQIADPIQYASDQGWMPQGQAYGGYQWAQLYLQSAIAAANQAYQHAVLQGQNEQQAKDNAWREAQAELERQMAVGYVNGQPTLAMQQLQQTGQYQSGLLDLQRQQQQLTASGMSGWMGGSPTLEREQWMTGQTGYYNGSPTMGREQMEGNLGLQYLNLLSQQSGPRDWVNYWNTVRGAQNTNLPAWATALQQRQNLPAWGANYGQQQGSVQPWQNATLMQGQQQASYGLSPNYQPSPNAVQPYQRATSGYVQPDTSGWGMTGTLPAQSGGIQGAYSAENLPGESQAGADQRYGLSPNYQPSSNAVQPYQRATGGYVQPDTSGWGSASPAQVPGGQQVQGGYNPTQWQQMGQQLSPWSVSPTQWNNMLPSEMEGLAGMIESGGGYAPDWLAQMQKSWPTGGNVNATSWWR
jgi:hypothetical protein